MKVINIKLKKCYVKSELESTFFTTLARDNFCNSSSTTTPGNDQKILRTPTPLPWVE